jgi:hypothetical protein
MVRHLSGNATYIQVTIGLKDRDNLRRNIHKSATLSSEVADESSLVIIGSGLFAFFNGLFGAISAG